MTNRGQVAVAVSFAVLGLVCTGCQIRRSCCVGAGWKVVTVREVTGLQFPECALPDPESGILYVSNIACAPGEFWTDDGSGFVSLLSSAGDMAALRWVQGTSQLPVHGPKGMCTLGEHLYFTDNTQVKRCAAATGTDVEVVASGFGKANDLATDGRWVWVSDTVAGKVYRLGSNGEKTAIQAPEGVNGITFHGRKMFAVSWGLHDLYELDPSGKAPPTAFGLAEHFAGLDAIEVLNDGCFVVSDYKGGKLDLVGHDRETVLTLAELESPADFGYDRERGLLYVPEMLANRLTILRIAHE